MRKRLVFRADDIGYTKTFDEGAFRAFDEGIATSADVMLDSPHTEEALKWLKKRPWISIGWHRHLWESPVLSKREIPHMADDEGRFIWRHDRSFLQNEVPYEEAYMEFEAEVKRCISIYGKAPDTAANVNMGKKKNSLELAYIDVLDKYGIAHSYDRENPKAPRDLVDKKYDDIDFCHVGFFAFFDDEDIRTHGDELAKKPFDLSFFDMYKPFNQLNTAVWNNNKQIWRIGGHPGYLDDHILMESSCSIHRVKDLVFCCGEETKEYIIKNRIELINQRDAIFGLNDFQNHLKEIDSPLWIGNM